MGRCPRLYYILCSKVNIRSNLYNEHMDEEFNDPMYLRNTRKIHVSSIEPLYWCLEDALYKGDLQTAKYVHTDFLYIAHYRKPLLKQGLQPAYINRLKQITYELYDDTYTKTRTSITIKEATEPKPLPFEKEADLRDHIAKNSELLSQAIGLKVKIMDTEVETDCGYRCDILAEGEQFYYPVELKITQANHAVVSQITKYCYYFYRKFRYSWYKPIQGIIVANGYDAWSINELRREGIWILEVRPAKENLIELTRIP
jgi:hypothetical protein